MRLRMLALQVLRNDMFPTLVFALTFLVLFRLGVL